MQIKKQQLDFLDWEFGAFFHFGIRTFYEGHKDWDLIEMDASAFNPKELDCENWVTSVKAAGAKYAILVCKHHDGFAIWPSKYTDYSVVNSPWKEGKGDVVAEFCAACRKHDLKIGIYYSPAQFGSVKMDKDEYDDYFINQIGELLTNYGKVDYIWFDGCGSEGHEYDTNRIVKEIRRMQPEILIFNMWDPDTKWVGNESGVAHSPNKLTVSALDFSINKDIQDLLDEPKFLPSECDCRMRLTNLFYKDCDVHTVKSVDELMGLYYYSVGRGANLLLNIGPDRNGRLPQPDKQNLLAFGDAIRKVKNSSLSCQVQSEAQKLTLEIEPQLVNHVELSEEIDPNCEIEYFEIKAYPFTYGIPITVYRGTTIGHKAICAFPTIRTKKLEITFDKPKAVRAQLIYVPFF